MRALKYLPVLRQKPRVILRALAAWWAMNLRGQPVLRGAELAVTTRMPGLNPSLSPPTSSMTPESSWPNTAGGTIIRA